LLVFAAIQNKTVKAETIYGKIPYKKSETEWAFWSAARTTVRQKPNVRIYNITPTIEIGINTIPAFLNQIIFI
jgi:hypothetical protein